MTETAVAPAKPLTGLEKEMAALLAQTADLNAGATAAKAEAGKVRRKSRDLEEQLNSMAAVDKWGAVAGRRSRRESRDYSEPALKIAFESIDMDKCGVITHADLAQAIREIEPNASEETVEEMMSFADKNADGKVDFSEFMKIMLYRPTRTASEPAPAAAPASESN